MARVRWTHKTDRILTLAGLSQLDIEREKEHFKARRTQKPRRRTVRMSELLQRALFRLGIDPQTTVAISEHLDELQAAYDEDNPETIEAVKQYDRDRKRTERAQNPDEYREKQRLYMQQYRAGKKTDAETRSENARKAAQARWGTAP